MVRLGYWSERLTVEDSGFGNQISLLQIDKLHCNCAALKSQGVEIYGIIFDLINTYEYKKPPELDKLFSREKTYRTPAELENILHQTGLGVDEILNHSGSYRKSQHRDCDFCPFFEPCT